jgi:hypothetical protein
MFIIFKAELLPYQSDLHTEIIGLCESKDEALKRMNESVITSLKSWRTYNENNDQWKEDNPGWKDQIDMLIANPEQRVCIRALIHDRVFTLYYRPCGDYVSINILDGDHASHEFWKIEPLRAL